MTNPRPGLAPAPASVLNNKRRDLLHTSCFNPPWQSRSRATCQHVGQLRAAGRRHHTSDLRRRRRPPPIVADELGAVCRRPPPHRNVLKVISITKRFRINSGAGAVFGTVGNGNNATEFAAISSPRTALARGSRSRAVDRSAASNTCRFPGPASTSATFRKTEGPLPKLDLTISPPQGEFFPAQFSTSIRLTAQSLLPT
jgi:hypothetical protein